MLCGIFLAAAVAGIAVVLRDDGEKVHRAKNVARGLLNCEVGIPCRDRHRECPNFFWCHGDMRLEDHDPIFEKIAKEDGEDTE